MKSIYLSVLALLVATGCSNGALESDTPIQDSAQIAPISGEIGAAQPDFPQFPVLVEDESANQFFFDGSDFSDQGLELMELVKGKSREAFLNLNIAFAEGQLSEDVLSCSQFIEGNVLYGFACNDERDDVVLGDFGFPLFLITTHEPELCQALPIGAFNDSDCEVRSSNFISDSGLYGYYRSSLTFEGITRETLTITREFIPPFIDPTFLPENCVFELHSDGTLLLSDFEDCISSIDRLIAEFGG